MIVFMADARKLLKEKHGISDSEDLPIFNLLYADDTFLIGTCNSCLQKYMSIIEELGGEYGLQLYWKKVEALPVKCHANLISLDGQ